MIRSTLTLVALALLLLTVSDSQEAKKPPSFKPSDAQLSNMKLVQKDAVISFKDKQLADLAVQRANANLSAAVKALSDECHKVRDANKWPATVECDMDSLEFKDVQPVKAEVPKK